jgi:cytochrome P450
MLELFGDDMRREPYPLYDQLRARSPLHVPGPNLWLVMDYEGCRRALHDTEAFTSSVGGQFEWLLFMDPPRHTRLRAIISKALTPRQVAGLEPHVREIVRELLASTGDQLDLEAELAAPLPIRVIGELLGLPRIDRTELERWGHAIMGLAATVIGSPEAAIAAGDAFRAADAEMQRYLADIVAAKRARPADDLLTRLVTSDERLDPEELLRFFQLLLAAGTETTTNLIDNAMVCLLDHPAELARLRADPALLPSMLEEVLRFRCPAQAMFRGTRRPVELNNRTIPEGQLVLVLIGAANRDPAHIVEPARFDIARSPNPHIGFGHGIHFCLGAALARLEARVAYEEMLARWSDIAYARAEPWTPRAPFHIHGPASLPLRVSVARR